MKMLRKLYYMNLSLLTAFYFNCNLACSRAFVLIGLKVTGSDMRQTGNDYFKEHKMADARYKSGRLQ